MKFGMRTPSFKKSIAARTSVRRYVRHSLGVKAPKGWGWVTNPRKAAYNRVYSRTTFSAGKGGLETIILTLFIYLVFGAVILTFKLLAWLFSEIGSLIKSTTNSDSAPMLGESLTETPLAPSQHKSDSPLCPRCNRTMIVRTARRGSNTGHQFWGCSGFPRCRGTRNIQNDSL